MSFERISEPEYLDLNPTGLAPTMVDDGFAPRESNAIVRYLSQRYGEGSLCPSDPHERARADSWMDWQATALWANFRPAFIGLIRTPESERDHAAVEASIQSTTANWAILESYLAENKYVGGHRFSLGDVPLGVTIHRWLSLDIERPPSPNLQAWYERLSERSAYEKITTTPIS